MYQQTVPSPATAITGENPLVITLKRVTGVLQAAKIPFALMGGFAAYARGGVLSAHDVDFLIRESDADAALTALAADGLRPVRPPEDWLVKVYDGDQLVDLIFRPIQRPVTDEVLAETDLLPVGGVHVPVLSATLLMAHKVLALNAHSADFGPSVEIARLLREQIDWAKLRVELAGSPYGEAFLVLVQGLKIVEGNPA